MVMAMGKVNKEALERALNSLAADGAISGWQRRPLNMYMIALASGEVIRPDAKETAMWVQGVMYAKLATAQQEAPPADAHEPPRIGMEGAHERSGKTLPAVGRPGCMVRR